MNRLIALAAVGALGLGCQPEPAPIAHPGALMASAPAVTSAADAIEAPVSHRDAIARADAIQSDAIQPDAIRPDAIRPDAIPAAAPIVPARAHRGSTGGSRPSAVDFTDLSCPPGQRGLSDTPGWAGGPGYDGTGHPDPDPLKAISDSEMLARAGDLGRADLDRQHALVSIGRRKLPGAMQILAQSLEASQPLPIREMAISGLIEHGGPQALPLLEGVLERDPSDQLRGMALWGVALYGVDKAHPAILRGLEDPEPGVQGMAVLATWALRDRPDLALPILEAAALSETRMAWQDALPMLGRLPTSDAANLLQRLARSTKGEKQRLAVGSHRAWLRNFPELCR